MNTEQPQDQDTAVDEEARPEIVVDGKVLDDDELDELLQKALEDLTDAEREALQPLMDQAEQEAATHVQVDPLALAGNLLVTAFEEISNPRAGNDRRVAQKIALAHAMSAHAHAAAARAHANAAQQQLAMMQAAQAAMAGRKGAGPASLVVPTLQLPNGRG